jgi:hypothetical protein
MKLFSEKSDLFANNELSGTGKGRWVTRSLFCLVVLVVSFLQSGSLEVRTADAFEKQLLNGEAVAKFRWVPAGNSHSVQKVTTETKIIIPIEFEVGGKITEVVFVISPKFKDFGIRIENPSSEVKQGIARARVIFNIASGMPLGRHDLVIQVFEKDGKTAIASGTIPFIILPNDMECLC